MKLGLILLPEKDFYSFESLKRISDTKLLEKCKVQMGYNSILKGTSNITYLFFFLFFFSILSKLQTKWRISILFSNEQTKNTCKQHLKSSLHITKYFSIIYLSKLKIIIICEFAIISGLHIRKLSFSKSHKSKRQNLKLKE